MLKSSFVKRLFAGEACLMPGFSGSAEQNARIAELAQLLRTVSGRYDQAARAASTSPL